MTRSWTEKLDDPAPPQVKPAPVDFAGMKRGQIMLVPTPRLIDSFIRTLPRGATMDVRALRAALAAEHEAEVTCPVSTGFQLRTVAEAAMEALGAGVAETAITPFWRVLDAASPTVLRVAGAAAIVSQQRALETSEPA